MVCALCESSNVPAGIEPSPAGNGLPKARHRAGDESRRGDNALRMKKNGLIREMNISMPSIQSLVALFYPVNLSV